MKKDHERAHHAGHHMHAKPAAWPSTILTCTFLDWIDEDQQRNSQPQPTHKMSLFGVRKGRRFSAAEKGLDPPSGGDRHSHDNDDGQKADGHGSHVNTSPLPWFLRHGNEGNQQIGPARECSSLSHEALSQGHYLVVL